MTLSIVVPIYNSEKYLEECLNSIITHKCITEIICVNDGSTDDSKNIIEKYMKTDSRILLINKKNTGYGDSVNRGIEAAKGDYVGIVESDDIACEEGFNDLLQVAEKTNADFIKGNFNCFDSKDGQLKYHKNFNSCKYNIINKISNNIELLFTAPAVWSAIYKKSFLATKGIKFLNTPGASYQDTSFAFKTWVLADSFILIDKPIVNYRQDSIGSSSNIIKNVFNIFNETHEMERTIKENQLYYLYPAFVKLKYNNYLWNYKRFNETNRIKFLLRWHPEAVNDFFAGYLEKKYWNDPEWLFMHNIIFQVDNIIDKNEKNLFNVNINKHLKQASPIYIYGAGKLGLKKKQYLYSLGIKITGFVVTEKSGNPNFIDNIPVFELGDINRDGIIIIGVSDKYKDSVLSELKKHFLLNNVFTG